MTDDGEILLDDKTYDTPDRAARAVGNETIDGWEFWGLVEDTGTKTLASLRAQQAGVHERHRVSLRYLG